MMLLPSARVQAQIHDYAVPFDIIRLDSMPFRHYATSLNKLLALQSA